MSHATVQDLLDLVSTEKELRDLTQEPEVANSITITAVLAAASSIVDIYATVRNVADAFIRQATCKIAIYYLFQRSNKDLPETVKLGFQETIALLKDLQNKQIKSQGAVSNFDTSSPRGRAKTISPLHLDIFSLI